MLGAWRQQVPRDGYDRSGAPGWSATLGWEETRMRVRVMTLAVGIALLAAACGSSGDQGAAPSTPPSTQATTTSTDKPTQTRRNKEPIPYEKVVETSLEDIQAFWAEELPAAYDIEYTPIEDEDIYAGTSDDPPPACTPDGGQGTYDDIVGNAFYCPLGRYVAYDDETLFPELYETFGEYAIAMVMAHEWGHAIQDQIGIIDSYKTIFIENQADCFAGAWTAHSLEGDDVEFRAEPKDLQSALGGMLKFSDQKGSDIRDSSAHGSGFDRINGFRLGFDQGVQRCKDYETPEGQPAIQNIPFTTEEDLANEGNLPYEQAIDLATIDLNAYWTDLAGRFGTEFTEVENVVRFSEDTAMPTCDGEEYDYDDIESTIFFCVDDNYVAWDDVWLDDVNREIGDFGLAVLVAQQWSVSFQLQDGLDKDVIESKNGRLQQSCFTGAWAFAVLNGDAHQAGAVSLSPGDLDEAILAFLAFSDTPDEKGETDTGSAFEQAGAFSDGFFFGEENCANMEL
jgi:predicted metalloprotease